MFVPTEGIGFAVARVSRETGIPVLTMEFMEDRCVVAFAIGKESVKPAERKPAVVPTLPEGPWERLPDDGHTNGPKCVKYRCGEVEATIPELAADYGIPLKAMRQRIYKRGYATTGHRRSKFDKIDKVRRMSPDHM